MIVAFMVVLIALMFFIMVGMACYMSKKDSDRTDGETGHGWVFAVAAMPLVLFIFALVICVG